MTLENGMVINPYQVRRVHLDLEHCKKVEITFGNGDIMLITKNDAVTLRYLINHS